MGSKTRLETNTSRWPGASWCALLLVALAADLLTPLLIWKGVLPASTRWVSHAAVAVAMIGAYVRMMVFDRIPRAVWLVGWLSAVGIAVALLRGQSIAATAWGWWIMFRFPMAAVFVYLQWDWPKSLTERLRLLCTAILAAEVIIQIGQFLMGEPPGDNLAGTFGDHGVANLMLFILFVLCLALGRWLAQEQWETLGLVLALGTVSTVLGSMKLFPFAVAALGLLAAAVFALRSGHTGKLVQHVVLVAAVVWAFFRFYDAVGPPAARGSLPMRSYLQSETLSAYLGGVTTTSGSGRYQGRYLLGRNYALTLGWDSIQADATTLLFGMGLGARGESRTLETAGVGLLEGDVGLSTGTTLLVMMQELGLLGMAIFGGFAIWTVRTLFSDIERHPESDATELRYALLLFSLLWPLWLWYTSMWLFRVPMLLYWAALGYVLAEPQLEKVEAEGSRVDSSSFHRRTGNAL